MKVLITGSNGFVAGSIIAQAPSHWEVSGVSKTKKEKVETDANYYYFDLLDAEKLAALFYEIRPDAVIHTAALANIDFCELNQSLAEKVNIDLVSTLTALCAEVGAKLVFCSTDTVFNGRKGNYSEKDPPGALNFYAESKIRSEQIVLENPTRNVAARLSLVMGLPVKGKGNSFLADMIAKLKNGDQISIPENEIRTPIDVITLGQALIELAENDFTGLIHLAGNTPINRYDMAQKIALELDLPVDLIVPVNSNALLSRAPRPNDASLNNTLAKSVLKTPMLSFTDGLALTLNFQTVI